MDAATLRNDAPELTEMRRALHAHPELGLDERWTSDFVAARLASWGWEVHRGLARTGVVGTLKVGDGGRSIGLRADMDALPIEEETGAPYASEIPGLMHACGHDGHTAMLLGAAKALAERRNFDGTVHLIFQPAEENFGGGRMMIEEGLFDRFPCDAVFALHNSPELPLGAIGVRDGAAMAASDEALIVLRSPGGHGARPETVADPIVAAASVVLALQTIVARNVPPTQPAVVTVGRIQGGTAGNIIPSRVELSVDVRSFDVGVRDLLERRIREIVDLQARSLGVEAEVRYERSYDAVFNHKAETDFVRTRAAAFVGRENVVEIPMPSMGAEDFGYMLSERPGSYFILGTRDTGDEKPLHHPGYDFNDAAAPIGAGFWVDLAENWLVRRPA